MTIRNQPRYSGVSGSGLEKNLDTMQTVSGYFGFNMNDNNLGGLSSSKLKSNYNDGNYPQGSVASTPYATNNNNSVFQFNIQNLNIKNIAGTDTNSPNQQHKYSQSFGDSASKLQQQANASSDMNRINSVGSAPYNPFLQNTLHQQNTLFPPLKGLKGNLSKFKLAQNNSFADNELSISHNSIGGKINQNSQPKNALLRSTTDVRGRQKQKEIAGEEDEPQQTARGKKMQERMKKIKNFAQKGSSSSYFDLIAENNKSLKHQNTISHSKYGTSNQELMNVFRQAGSSMVSGISPHKMENAHDQSRMSQQTNMKRQVPLFNLNETLISMARQQQALKRNQSLAELMRSATKSKYFNSSLNLSQKDIEKKKKFQRAKSMLIPRKQKDVIIDKEMTINELKDLLLRDYEDKKKSRKKAQLEKSMKSKQTQKDQEDSISSDDCKHNHSYFQLMDLEEKQEHMINLWKQAYVKARAGAKVVTFFNDLSRKIYLYGVSQNLIEIEKLDKIPVYVLTANSRIKNIWHIVNICLLIYTATYMPFRIAFIDDTSTEQAIVEWIVDALFMLDMLFNFFTAFEDKYGVYHFRLKKIAVNYIKGWFFLDSIACFPSQYITVGGTVYQKLVRLLRLPKLYRSLKIMKILESLTFLEDNPKYKKFINILKMNFAIVRLVQGMISALILTHLFGCFWFLASKIYDHDPDTWIGRNTLEDADQSLQYLRSLYWSTQTVITVGYGDMPAVTPAEMALCLIWMIFGVGFYSFIIGNFSSIISGNIEEQASLQNKIKGLMSLGKLAEIPQVLSAKIKNYMENNYKAMHNFDEEQQLIKMLPPSLRDEVQSNQYGEIIDKIKFFREEIQDPDFQWIVLPLLKQVKLAKGDVLYWRGDHAEDIYFLISGTIRMYTDKGYPYTKFTSGDMFGDQDALLNLPRDGKAIAATHVKLMVLRVETLVDKCADGQVVNFMKMVFMAKKRREHFANLSFMANRKAKIRQNLKIWRKKKEQARQLRQAYFQSALQNKAKSAHVENGDSGITPRSAGSLSRAVTNIKNNISKVLFSKSVSNMNLISNEVKVSSVFGGSSGSNLQLPKFNPNQPQQRKPRFRKPSFNSFKKSIRAKSTTQMNQLTHGTQSDTQDQFVDSKSQIAREPSNPFKTSDKNYSGMDELNLSQITLKTNKIQLENDNPIQKRMPRKSIMMQRLSKIAKEEDLKSIALAIPDVPTENLPNFKKKGKKLHNIDKVLRQAFKGENIDEIYEKYPLLKDLIKNEQPNLNSQMQPKYSRKVLSSSMNTSRIVSRKGSMYGVDKNSDYNDQRDRNSLSQSRHSQNESRTPTQFLTEKLLTFNEDRKNTRSPEAGDLFHLQTYNKEKINQFAIDTLPHSQTLLRPANFNMYIDTNTLSPLMVKRDNGIRGRVDSPQSTKHQTNTLRVPVLSSMNSALQVPGSGPHQSPYKLPSSDSLFSNPHLALSKYASGPVVPKLKNQNSTGKLLILNNNQKNSIISIKIQSETERRMELEQEAQINKQIIQEDKIVEAKTPVSPGKKVKKQSKKNLLPPRKKESHKSQSTGGGAQNVIMNIQDNTISFRPNGDHRQNKDEPPKLKKRISSVKHNPNSTKSILRPSFYLLQSNSVVRNQQTGEFPLSELLLSDKDDSINVPSLQNVSEKYASRNTLDKIKELSQMRTSKNKKESPLDNGGQLGTVSYLQVGATFGHLDSLPQTVSLALQKKSSSSQPPVQHYNVSSYMYSNSQITLNNFSEAASTFQENQRMLMIQADSSQPPKILSSKDNLGMIESIDEKMKFLDDELLNNQDLEHHMIIISDSLGPNTEGSLNLMENFDSQQRQKSDFRERIISKIVDDFSQQKSNELITQSMPDFKQIDKKEKGMVSNKASRNSRGKKRKHKKRIQNLEKENQNLMGEDVEEEKIGEIDFKKIDRKSGDKANTRETPSNSQLASRIQISLENIQFSGDTEVEGLVQLNADMNHISLNIYETFTLFDIYKQGANSLFTSLESIKLQKQIVDHRQDSIDKKIESIEDQLEQIRVLNSQIKKVKELKSGSYLELPNAPKQIRKKPPTYQMVTRSQPLGGLSSIQEIRY